MTFPEFLVCVLLVAFLGAWLGTQFRGHARHQIRVCALCGTENVVCLKSPRPRCGSCLATLGGT